MSLWHSCLCTPLDLFYLLAECCCTMVVAAFITVSQVLEFEANVAAAAAKTAELADALETANADLAAARATSAQQASRLAHLESEFEALQEVMGEGEQRDIVGRLLSRISNLQAAAAAAERTRRELHNQMVELRGNVRWSRVLMPHQWTQCMANR